ncbi:YjjG family noncanonical pyrimidine nucleotidase [Paenibacillus sp. Marseille-Q4541]|uniref:YjjG family noncanonical pyrimidine nucleotidase n=1 Tax=Paenibacillus sp. Marseille-Q4541 TaxID=2831522 RepID=UPI001BA7E104|nr:YjjG family noncanonical pyrimidine nucleotidase [Paenibacillus sp. Marseille-Q4541]
MSTYKALFFDVDDTLLDFCAAENNALQLLCKDQQLAFTQETETSYKTINQQLWRAFEEGKLSRDEVINTRFSLFFKEWDQEVDGILMERTYRSYLEQGHQLIDGAMELLTQLQHKYEIYIVTNGVSRTQDIRLRSSGLHPLVKQIFVSEDTGFQKPMKEFFDYVFDRIPNLVPSEGLIIGDSLNADIRGGQKAGLDTCWYNPNRVVNQTEVKPTYEIQSLQQLYPILEK